MFFLDSLKLKKQVVSKRLKIYFNRNNVTNSPVDLQVEKMESTNQGFPREGNPSPFLSWGEVGPPHMATLSLPGLTIGFPVWLFSTSVIQNPTIPKQSNQ